MINPAEIADNLVSLLRQIPALVDLMGADNDRIYAYHDQYPERVSLQHAVHQMPSPSVMVVWTGTVPGNLGASEVWKHQFSIFLRAPETLDGDPPTGYYELFRLITKGIPTGSTQPMINTTVHESCQPMDVPSIQRQIGLEGLDYFEVTVSFAEIGDQ